MKLAHHNQGENLVTHWIQIMITAHQNQRFPMMIRWLIFSIYMLQPLYFNVVPTLHFQKETKPSIFVEFVTVILRPEIWVANVWLSDISLSFWIPFTIFIIQKLSILLLMLQQRYISTQIQSDAKYLQQFNSVILNFLTKIVGVYEQLLCTFLFIPLSGYCILTFHTIFESQSKDGQVYIEIILAIITFTLIQIDTILNFLICDQSINLIIIGFEKARITSKTYLVYFLRFLQLILQAVIHQSDTAQVLQSILTISLAILDIQNQIINYTYILRFQRWTLLIGNGILISFAAVSFALAVGSIGRSYLTISLIFFPLTVQFLLYLDRFQQNNALINLYKNKKIDEKMLNFQVIKYLNHEFDTYSFPLKQALIHRLHRVKCRNMNCLCQNEILIADIFQANIVTMENEKKFIYKRLKDLQKLSTCCVDQDEREYLTISNAILLYNFGWPIFAVKRFNSLLYSKSKQDSEPTINSSKGNRRKSLQRQDQSSSQQTIVDERLAEIMSKQQKKSTYEKIHLNIGYLNKEKLNYLISKAKNDMKMSLGSQQITQGQADLSDQIQNYLINEFEMKSYLEQIKLITMEKIQFNYYLIRDQEGNIDELYGKIKSLNKKIFLFTKKLKFKYFQFKSQRLKNAICFFEAEINNDLFEAFKYFNLSSVADDKLLKMQYREINLFSDTVSYLIVSMEEDFQNLSIEEYSSNFHKQKEQFLNLLPTFIVQEHPIMISRFINSGQSRFYRNFNQSYMIGLDGFIKVISMCFDNIQLFQSDRIMFANFIYFHQDVQAIILLDVNRRIGGLTKTFFTILGIENLNNINSNMFDGQPIEQFIPNFEEIVIEDELIIKKCNVEFNFYFIHQNITSNSISESQHPMKYAIDITVIKREIFGFYYYIIEIDNANYQTITGTYRYNQEQTFTGGNEFNISGLDLSVQEGAIRDINNITIKSREPYKQQINQQKPQTQPQPKPQLDLDDQLFIFSPNQSNLIEKSNQQLIRQEFYCNEQISNKSQNNDVLKDQEKELKNQISQSNIANINQSKYFKKYDLISRLQSPSREQIPTKLCISFFSIQILILFVYAIIIITLEDQDMETYIKEIDMISLHASIMGPHDNFFGTRATIAAYMQLNREGYFNATVVKSLIDPLYQYIGLGYEELRLNFYSLLTNPFLQDFFNNRNEVVNFMKSNDSETYKKTISFREELLVILQYQFAYKRIFEKRGVQAGQPYQVFQYANYFNLHDNLEYMTNEIQQYSIQRSINGSDKWSTNWLVFQLIAISLSLVVFYYIHRNLYNLDTIIRLLIQIDKNTILQEIERLKSLQKAMDQNANIIFLYCYDQGQKEKSFSLQTTTQHAKSTQKQTHQKAIRQDSKARLSRFAWFLGLFLFYSIFCVYSTVINEQVKIYLTKYSETTNFFRIVQDMKFRSGNIYLYREIRMRWSNFTYLPPNEVERLYVLIEKSKLSIQTYLNNYIRPDQKQYLLSDQFLSFFYEVQKNQLCNYLDEAYILFYGRYCKIALDGTLMEGMITNLNFILNDIRNQQAVNNFSKRAEVHFYEMEGSQITTRVFVNMSSQLQNGIIQITRNLTEVNKDLSTIYICFNLILLIIVILVIRPLLIHQYYLVRRMVLLIPLVVQLEDDALERELRLIIMTQKL